MESTGGWQSVDPRSITAETISASITLAFSAVGLSMVLLLVFFRGFERIGLLALALGLVYFSIAGVMLLWPRLRWEHLSWRVDENVLEIRRGVFWQSWTQVPRSRIQHMDLAQGPIARAFSLATLVVHTAGTQHAIVVLPGLSRPVAEQIRDGLLGMSGDDAV